MIRYFKNLLNNYNKIIESNNCDKFTNIYFIEIMTILFHFVLFLIIISGNLFSRDAYSCIFIITILHILNGILIFFISDDIYKEQINNKFRDKIIFYFLLPIFRISNLILCFINITLSFILNTEYSSDNYKKIKLKNYKINLNKFMTPYIKFIHSKGFKLKPNNTKYYIENLFYDMIAYKIILTVILFLFILIINILGIIIDIESISYSLCITYLLLHIIFSSITFILFNIVYSESYYKIFKNKTIKDKILFSLYFAFIINYIMSLENIIFIKIYAFACNKEEEWLRNYDKRYFPDC